MADKRRNRPLKAFISYAHKDESLVRELEAHLGVLTHSGDLSTWTDRRIAPGEQWTSVISEQIDTADLILVMVSADFLSSDYAYGVEFKRAVDRAKSGGARLVPVILRPVDWKELLLMLSKHFRAKAGRSPLGGTETKLSAMSLLLFV